jgi:polyhydroxyalkanoate synthase
MGENLERLNENLAKVEELSNGLWPRWRRNRCTMPALRARSGPLHEGGRGLLAEMMTNPAKLIEHQVATGARR